MTVNKAILVGNLGQDPELRTTGSGTPVATLRIATSDRRKDQSGNWVDHTEWHSVTVFGRNAENAQKYLSKGRQVYVEGRIQTRKWQDREGRDRYSTEVVADQLRFLSSGAGGRDRQDRGGYQGGGNSSYGGGGYNNQGGGQGQAGNEPPPPQPQDQMPYQDDDIPF